MVAPYKKSLKLIFKEPPGSKTFFFSIAKPEIQNIWATFLESNNGGSFVACNILNAPFSRERRNHAIDICLSFEVGKHVYFQL